MGFAAVAADVAYGELGLPLSECWPRCGRRRAGQLVHRARAAAAAGAPWRALAGAALALSGVIFQTFGRNPLASPDIIGVTSGRRRSFGVTAFVLGASPSLAPVAAFAGALRSRR